MAVDTEARAAVKLIEQNSIPINFLSEAQKIEVLNILFPDRLVLDDSGDLKALKDKDGNTQFEW